MGNETSKCEPILWGRVINQPFDLSGSQFPTLYHFRVGIRWSLRLLSALNVIILESAQNKEGEHRTGEFAWVKCGGKLQMW